MINLRRLALTRRAAKPFALFHATVLTLLRLRSSPELVSAPRTSDQLRLLEMMTLLCCCKRPKSPTPPEQVTRLPTPPPPVKLPDFQGVSTPASATRAKTPQTDTRAAIPLVYPVPGAPVEPIELEELADDDSVSDDEPPRANRTKSLSTLGFVKTQLRRHLSIDSIHRRSRTSVGQSDEEIARRAELRRLMHKRIQEELQREDTSISVSERRSSTRYSILYNEELPGGGPRDNVEFSVVELIDDGGPQGAKASPTPSGPAQSGIEEISHYGSRRASCPGCFPADRREIESSPARPIALRDQMSLPQLSSLSPRPPVAILDEREPETPLEDWRFASAGGQGRVVCGERPNSPLVALPSEAVHCEVSREQKRGGCRIDGIPHSEPVPDLSSLTPKKQTSRDSVAELQNQSPLSTWLRSQGLYSRSQSATGSAADSPDEEDEIHEAQVVTLARPTSSIHGLDGSRARDGTTSKAVHLYDMDIHRQLKARGLSTPTASPTRSQGPELHLRGPSLATPASRISSLSLPPAINSFSAMPKENSRGISPCDESMSSVYDSSPRSDAQPSPERHLSPIVPSRRTASIFQPPGPRRK